jgi:hypothetical protein
MLPSLNKKGKMKVLTSEKAKQGGSVDLARQVMLEDIHKESRFPKSQIEGGESSKPRVTSRILLNKWQRQQEKERYQKHKYEEKNRRYEEEMKLLTLNNCPEFSDKYTEYRQVLPIADPSMKELEG